ncbi:mucin-19 [Anopheles bellator]|uniref:mucin-19 n=1 Tax=Anopheles bellator TaxID=139047 RepID=UPI00264892D0|nr:mucin-19 [Anopheles bellator]
MSSGRVSPTIESRQNQQSLEERPSQQEKNATKQQVATPLLIAAEHRQSPTDADGAEETEVEVNNHYQLTPERPEREAGAGSEQGLKERQSDAWTVVLEQRNRLSAPRDVDGIVIGGSFQQQQQSTQSPKKNELKDSLVTADGGIWERVEEHHTRHREPIGGINCAEEHIGDPIPTGTTDMRDPQESHHGPAAPLPSAPTPLGEVESGEDSDCVMVNAPTVAAERKVEPLKINLTRDREPLRTIIKLTPGASSAEHTSIAQQLSPTTVRDVSGSPKITIKPPKPPPNTNSSSSSSIPKLTIKPLINPAGVDSGALRSDEPGGGVAEQMQIIPKLLIKSSCASLGDGTTQHHAREGSVMEPHIVPKLTIRGVNNHNNHHHHHHPQLHSQSVGSDTQQQHTFVSEVGGPSGLGGQQEVDGMDSSGTSGSGSSSPSPTTPLVPKLTIKMDNHHHLAHVQQQQHSDGAIGGGGMAHREGTIPKLHIKTFPSEGGGLIATTASSALSPQPSTATSGGGGSGSSPVLTSSEGVKLTIKPLPEPPKLPKLTIKTSGLLGAIAETSDASLVSSTSSFSPKVSPLSAQVGGELQVLPMAPSALASVKLLSPPAGGLHHHPAQNLQPASPSDQHSNISSSSIPKLTIKPIPPKVGEHATAACGPSAHEAPIGIPKLTIKPIPHPTMMPTLKSARGGVQSGENSASETSINSLIDSSSVSSSSCTNAAIITSPASTSALRMTIKVPQSMNESSNPALVSALTGPPLAVGATAAVAQSPASSVVTKLNIKPILPPSQASSLATRRAEPHTEKAGFLPNDDGEEKDGPSGASTPPSGEEPDQSVPIVIPKVTIKTLANPRGQETEILSTPKVTLKPIPKPAHQQQEVATEPVAINNNSSSSSGMVFDASLGGVVDSPRIILKINKGSSSTTTTTTTTGEQQQQACEESVAGSLMGPAIDGSSNSPMTTGSILANELKRPAATAEPGGVITTLSSSSSSSSVSSTSTSTSVSTSTSSSSAGSDPASPSSGGGGDQGDPGSPEAKKSKLDEGRITERQTDHPIVGSLLAQHSVLQQTLLQNRAPISYQQQQQQQRQSTVLQRRSPAVPTGAGLNSCDVIVIDDDSKSGNETLTLLHAGSSRKLVNTSTLQQQLLGYGVGAAEELTTPPVVVKTRRTRGGSSRTGGGRQSRRGSGGRLAAAKLLPSMIAAAVAFDAPLVNDDRDEGSSSDCMIVDEPTTATTVEKNGTASNSSIGSGASSSTGGIIASMVSSGGYPTLPGAGIATGRTPGSVRMSRRRGAGQLLKEVLAHKSHDQDSGVDEGLGGGRIGASSMTAGGGTPSKRPRGRPKKQMIDLGMVETNGGGSSSSMEGGPNSGHNSMMMMAMMAGSMNSSIQGTSLLHPNAASSIVKAAELMLEGITPFPVTPVRTPRTRGRGRGRGRAKLLGDVTPTLGGPFYMSPNNADPSLDPLYIGSPSTATPAYDAEGNFLFNRIQTPRGRGSRGSRRGGGRGSRTPRGAGSRGASKAALAAMLAASGGSGSPGWPAQLPIPDGPMVGSPDGRISATELTPRGGKVRRPRGGAVTTRGKRKASTEAKTRTPRSKKAALAAAAAAASADGKEFVAGGHQTPAKVAADGRSPITPNNNIFMTPMAGGLDPFRPKLQIRELKTPKNAIKSNTPPSGALLTPAANLSGAPGGVASLQLFEEDTRMSGDFNFTTPVRLIGTGDGCLQQNDESQSSYLSSTSVTQDATTSAAVSTNGAQALPADAATAAAIAAEPGKDGMLAATTITGTGGGGGVGTSSSNSSTTSSSRRPKGKMEVLDAHRAQFTVDLLAEYEWPPPSPGTRGTDTFMLQEQIAEYLGVKSFKRKYPDLMRRPVEMEERNFLLEQGLASEKMCDLGLTAVYASEILDIMCNDYPEKYEEYTRYSREKHFRELSNRQRQQQEEVVAAVAAAAAAAAAIPAAPIDRAKLQKEKAIESASNWNSTFNKERRDTRRACMDLQTYVVHVPRRNQCAQTARPEGTAPSRQLSNYPVALVPGQFSEYYTTYTPEQLACYPINTMLLDPQQLEEIVSSERYKKLAAEEARRAECYETSCSSSNSSSSGSSDSDTDSDDDGSSNGGEDSGTSSDGESGGKHMRKSRSQRGRSSSSDSSSNTDNETEVSGATERRKVRRKRKVASSNSILTVDGEDEDKNVKPTAVVTPVRRSSRGLSAGATTTVPLAVEVKIPTDSDDSDVPLSAHAAKRKNAVTTAAIIVSAGGGKRMVDEKPTLTVMKRPPLNPYMCAVCLGPENKNKYNKPERFVRCDRCRRKAHPSCIGMSSVMYRRVQQYKWQCTECKLCMKCNRRPAAIDSKMVYCDQCDRGFHLACKGLRNLPDGRWHCSICTICSQCGSRTPEGHPNAQLTAQQRQHLAMVAEWTHQYCLNALTRIREHVRTLCVPCVRERRQRMQQENAQQTTVAAAVAATPARQSNTENHAILNNNNNNKPISTPMGGVTVDRKAQLTIPVTTGGPVNTMKVVVRAPIVRKLPATSSSSVVTVQQQHNSSYTGGNTFAVGGTVVPQSVPADVTRTVMGGPSVRSS